MAKKVTVTLVDDFDGEGPADETVEFSIDGVSFEIDLSARNAQKLRDELRPWSEAGRRVGGQPRRPSAHRSAPQRAGGSTAAHCSCR